MTRSSGFAFAFALPLALLAGGCGDGKCVPGHTASCACSGGLLGVQTCQAEQVYGECDCSTSATDGVIKIKLDRGVGLKMDRRVADGEPVPLAAKLEPFSAITVGLDDGGASLRVSFSNIAGADGCALTAAPTAVPASDGHQVLVQAFAMNGEDCKPGSYPLSNCGADPFGDFTKTCAQYRKWQQGKIVEAATAIGGSMVVALWASECRIDVNLTFGSAGTFVKKATVLHSSMGKPPYCVQPQ